MSDYYDDCDINRPWRKERDWKTLPHRSEGETLADYVERITEMVHDCPRSDIRLELNEADKGWLRSQGILL